MHFSTLNEELNSLDKKYDYGVMPNSITVFVRDSINKTGKIELTLLEGIMIIIEASLQGYMVLSCTPLFKDSNIKNALAIVNSHLEETFDTMDKLLITISPLFADRFIQKLQSSFTTSSTLISSSSSSNITTAVTTPIIDDINLKLLSTSTSVTVSESSPSSTPQNNLNLDFLPPLELNHLDFDWSH
ncbi:unnamed protein product [Cunninghamella blakesleeana]